MREIGQVFSIMHLNNTGLLRIVKLMYETLTAFGLGECRPNNTNHVSTLLIQ